MNIFVRFAWIFPLCLKAAIWTFFHGFRMITKHFLHKYSVQICEINIHAYLKNPIDFRANPKIVHGHAQYCAQF